MQAADGGCPGLPITRLTANTHALTAPHAMLPGSLQALKGNGGLSQTHK